MTQLRLMKYIVHGVSLHASIIISQDMEEEGNEVRSSCFFLSLSYKKNKHHRHQHTISIGDHMNEKSNYGDIEIRMDGGKRAVI